MTASSLWRVVPAWWGELCLERKVCLWLSSQVWQAAIEYQVQSSSLAVLYSVFLVGFLWFSRPSQMICVESNQLFIIWCESVIGGIIRNKSLCDVVHGQKQYLECVITLLTLSTEGYNALCPGGVKFKSELSRCWVHPCFIQICLVLSFFCET